MADKPLLANSQNPISYTQPQQTTAATSDYYQDQMSKADEKLNPGADITVQTVDKQVVPLRSLWVYYYYYLDLIFDF